MVHAQPYVDSTTWSYGEIQNSRLNGNSHDHSFDSLINQSQLITISLTEGTTVFIISHGLAPASDNNGGALNGKGGEWHGYLSIRGGTRVVVGCFPWAVRTRDPNYMVFHITCGTDESILPRAPIRRNPMGTRLPRMIYCAPTRRYTSVAKIFTQPTSIDHLAISPGGVG